jgi:hypothetical protein
MISFVIVSHAWLPFSNHWLWLLNGKNPDASRSVMKENSPSARCFTLDIMLFVLLLAVNA